MDVTHPQLVAALVKPPLDIINSLSAVTADLWHGATGVAGECGELLEGLIRYSSYRSDEELTAIRNNALEESGDIFFYMEQIVQRAGIFVNWDDADERARQAVISPDMVLPNAAMVAVYGSQVLDTVKKAAIYNKPLDVPLVTEQMNSLAEVVLVVGYQFGFSREQALQSNIDKLKVRYAGLSYSDQAAQDRADKVEAPKPTYIGEAPAGYTPPERKHFGAEPAVGSAVKTPITSDMQDVADAETSSR